MTGLLSRLEAAVDAGETHLLAIRAVNADLTRLRGPRLGRGLGDHTPRGYVSYADRCSDNPADRVAPSAAHLEWHRRWLTEPCAVAREEWKWWRACKRAGRHLPDWQGRRYERHLCGPAELAERPSGAAAKAHRRAGTPVCGRALAEHAWDAWVRSNPDKPITDYTYKGTHPETKKEGETR